MPVLFEFRNRDIYMHHTRTESPDPSDIAFRMHLHNLFELYYFLSGDGYFVIEGNSYPLIPGTILLMRPGETHFAHIISDKEPYERIAVLFSHSCIEGNGYTAPLLEPFMNHELGHGNCYPPTSENAGFIDRCFKNMKRGENDSDRNAAVIVGLYSILGELQCMSKSEGKTAPASTGLVRDIVEYINSHISEDWSLDALANHFSYDKYYLNRKFRREMGSGIWEYTIKKRIQSAQQDIYLSGNIKAGFERSGFGDYSTFWRQYKKITGMSPAEDIKLYNEKKR
jgi:AraC-like DNA-binding protein